MTEKKRKAKKTSKNEFIVEQVPLEELDIQTGDAVIIVRHTDKGTLVRLHVKTFIATEKLEELLSKGVEQIEKIVEIQEHTTQGPRAASPWPPEIDEETKRSLALKNRRNCGREQMPRMLCVTGSSDDAGVKDRFRWFHSHESDSYDTDDACPGFVKPTWRCGCDAGDDK